MSDDIVTWLRSILHNDRSVELRCREAADEIERLREGFEGCCYTCEPVAIQNQKLRQEVEQLRKERDEVEPMLNELWERRTEATEMREEIKRLRVERDEVRQSYCSLMEAYRGGDGRVTANKLGWGYLFEEDKPCQ